MNSLILVLVIVLFVIAIVFYASESQIQKRLAKRVERAYTMQNDQREQAIAICQNACQRIETLASKKSNQTEQGWRVYPPGTIPANTFARAQAFIALLAHQSGDTTTAESLMKPLKEHFKAAPRSQLFWLLNYHLMTKDVSTFAVSHYLNTCADADLLPEHRDQIESCLQQACQPTSAMDQGDLTVRLKWLAECQKRFPNADWVSLLEGQVHVYRNDFARAGKVLGATLSGDPPDPLRKLWIARAFAATDREAAIAKIAKVGRKDGAPADLIVEAATHLSELGAHRESCELAKCISTDDEILLSRQTMLLGKAATELKDFETAERLLNESVQHDPNNPDALVALAEIALSSGDATRIVEVIGTLRDSIQSGVKSPRLQFALAGLLWSQGKFVDAADRFQAIVEERYRTSESFEMLLRCRAQAGQAEQIEHDIKRYPKAIAPGVGAFLTGTAFLHADRPGEALAYFCRAAKLLDTKTQLDLLRRVATNRHACYRQMASEYFAAGNFAQAAAVLEAMSGAIKPGHADFQPCLSDLAEAHLRHAIELLKPGNTTRSGSTADYAKAGKVLKECLATVARIEQVRGKPPARKLPLHALAAGVMVKAEDYQQASTYYDVILSMKPDYEFAKFGRALCHAKLDVSPVGQQGLRELAGSETPFSCRAAIALAESHAQNNAFKDALDALEPLIQAGEKADAGYYRDACCRSVIYQVKCGQPDTAKGMATKLLTNGNASKADGIIGALLAHEGDYVRCLSFLESSVPQGSEETAFGSLLGTAYRKAIALRCADSQFDAIDDLVVRFQERFNDPVVDQLGQLTQLAKEPNTKIGMKLASAIERIVTETQNPEPTLLRNTISILKKLGVQMLRDERFADAQKLITRMNSLWKLSVEGNELFWNGYIESFNVGKVHPYSNGFLELQSRLAIELGGTTLYLLQQALLGNTYPSIGMRSKGQIDKELASQAWTQFCSLVGKTDAIAQFRDRIDVTKLLTHDDRAKRPDLNREMLTWLIENIDAAPQWKQVESQLMLGEALIDLERGNYGAFKDRFAKSAKSDSNTNMLYQRFKQLSIDNITLIADKANTHPILILKRLQGADSWRGCLLSLVVGFGDVDLALRKQGQALTPLAINQIFDQVAQAIAKQ